MASTPALLPGQSPCNTSLILAHRPTDRIILILGSGKLAMSRARSALEAGASPLIVGLSSGGLSDACSDIQDGVDSGNLQWRDASRSLLQCWGKGESEASAREWALFLDEIDEGEQRRLFAVCVTDTLHSGDDNADSGPSSSASTSTSTTSLERATMLAHLCRQRRIPINVADRPELCDFSFPATHRFPATSLPSTPAAGSSSHAQQGGMSSLQIAVTTNGRGCRLAGRLRREIISALPRNVGDAVERVGEMRELAKREGRGRSTQKKPRTKRDADPSQGDYFESRPVQGPVASHEEDLSYETTPLNSPVPQLGIRQSSDNLLTKATASARAQQEAEAERTKRRMRWVAQISEYWPIEYLGAMDVNQMNQALASLGEDSQKEAEAPAEQSTLSQGSSHMERTTSPDDDARGRSLTPIAAHCNAKNAPRARSQHSLSITRPPPPQSRRTGHVYLLGSGPGHPGLLTVMAHRLLTSSETQLVLSDKLVPAPILRLIPPTTPLVIAKKFPGNAEGAQSELISLAVEAALKEGKNVVRLKQGDPFVYGRGGEEVLAFRKAGIDCTVVPGISSALAAPLMLGVPVTQRGAADSLVLCTGVGRGGKQVKLPGYQRSRSLVLLMGVARLKEVIQVLTSPAGTGSGIAGDEAVSTTGRDGAAYPLHTPIALIERASSSDQRLIASTLSGIVDAIERCGEQRPPGMLLIGWAVMALEGPDGNVDILEDADEAVQEQRDQERVAQWLGSHGGFVKREGLDDVYARALNELVGSASATQQSVHAIEATPDLAKPATAGEPADVFALGARAADGWAPARYHATSGAPERGWTQGEAATRG
ncbi:unnamed protein product [Parajaminaea phylloscopi]